MKVISFSLYGSLPKYCIGAIKNAVLAQLHFPDFVCFFYVDNTVPEKYIRELEIKKNVKVIQVYNKDIPKRMWRFLAIDESEVICMISRDVDSRLTAREASLVYNWLSKPQLLMSIKDNPIFHRNPEMLAGMWGLKKIPDFSMLDTIISWLKNSNIINLDNIELDQLFLSQVIYRSYRNELCYYDNFKISVNDNPIMIPMGRKGYRFIGEVFDEFDKPDDHWKAIRDFELFKYGFIGKIISSFLWKIKF